MRISIIAILLFCFVSIAKAELPYPPIISNVDRSLQQYLIDVFNNKNIIPVTTTAPNGNRDGRVGELVIYGDAIWYNASSSTLWIRL
jgi:hypothetical protein